MNYLQRLLLVGLLLFGKQVFGQTDSVTVLDEVILTDVRLLHFSNNNTTVLKDSVLKRNGSSLTDLLQFNSGIYLKENGLGMVSSPSFRGTNASQTAVVWNGININSLLTGQVDFNTIVPSNYDDVQIRKGGGSVQFGSGAIGGSIHLQDQIQFNSGLENEIELFYGSFETRGVDYRISKGSDQFTFGFGVNYRASENDYKYLGTDQKNENGDFETININGKVGYKISDKQLLKFYHQTFLGDRNFSGTLTAPSNSKYKDYNTRNLLEWNHFKNNQVQRLKVGYLYEKYKYFGNNDRPEFSFGQTNTFLANYDYKITVKNLIFDAIADFNHVNGKGSSVADAKRNTFAGTLLFKHNVSSNLSYDLNIRKEFVNDFDSPLVYALNLEYRPNKKNILYVNGSKNHRVPTFNEIYWITGGGSSGNPEILPESSYQLEIGHALLYSKWQFKGAAYYISSEDRIQWRPNDSGIWTPINISEASNYGLEVSFKYAESWGQHHLVWDSGYFYTQARNDETNNDLMYVPKHKATSNISWSHLNWKLFYQLFYNGSVYTTSDNSDELPDYSVSNLGVSREFKLNKDLDFTAKFQLNNIWNKNYQNVAFRPMPGRNMQLKLNLNF
ncbi:TonB-dependent receptor [Euzebyella marina]|uniref:TonB-dependent receptor n=1 Tax=Euzebyella marina TaxID=1761453 RepID=A0A3G2L6H9_9FLAO|nr:TonB-dependent receptor [Euzebyella marina]AYN67813.1 TonB-dependent receptor [Euzebyella marina]